jgi:hypothetical protein
MTDADWQAAGWQQILLALFPTGTRSKAAARKLRLAMCRAMRLTWDQLPDDRCRAAVEVAEAAARPRVLGGRFGQREVKLAKPTRCNG